MKYVRHFGVSKMIALTFKALITTNSTAYFRVVSALVMFVIVLLNPFLKSQSTFGVQAVVRPDLFSLLALLPM